MVAPQTNRHSQQRGLFPLNNRGNVDILEHCVLVTPTLFIDHLSALIKMEMALHSGIHLWHLLYQLSGNVPFSNSAAFLLWQPPK